VGDWSPGEYAIDLSGHIASAGTYRLRFASQSAASNLADRIEVVVDAVPRPGLVRRDRGRGDIVWVTVPEPAHRFVLTATLAGEGGQVLMRRI
jgi:hypothetical protein